MTNFRHKLALLLALSGCDAGEAATLPVEDASFGSKLPDLDAAACRVRCQLRSSCASDPPNGFPNFIDTREQWRARCGDAGGNFPYLIAGTCEGGGTFVHFGTGKSIDARYFGSDGVFAAMTTSVDFSTPPCQGLTYWPSPPSCVNGTVTDVLCGGGFHSVGDVLP